MSGELENISAEGTEYSHEKSESRWLVSPSGFEYELADILTAAHLSVA
jgi:hypothetical protein